MSMNCEDEVVGVAAIASWIGRPTRIGRVESRKRARRAFNAPYAYLVRRERDSLPSCFNLHCAF